MPSRFAALLCSTWHLHHTLRSSWWVCAVFAFTLPSFFWPKAQRSRTVAIPFYFSSSYRFCFPGSTLSSWMHPYHHFSEFSFCTSPWSFEPVTHVFGQGRRALPNNPLLVRFGWVPTSTDMSLVSAIPGWPSVSVSPGTIDWSSLVRCLWSLQGPLPPGYRSLAFSPRFLSRVFVLTRVESLPLLRP